MSSEVRAPGDLSLVVKDAFQSLELPRSAWLDEEEIKRKFYTLSVPCHPDKVHNLPETSKKQAETRFVALNRAFNVLKDPRTRLKHFLELETGRDYSEISEVPDGLTDWFKVVHEALGRAKKHLQGAPNNSPLEKVQRMKVLLEIQTQLQETAKTLSDQVTQYQNQVARLADHWAQLTESDDTQKKRDILHELESLYYQLTYLTRWHSQVQQKMGECFQAL